MRLIELNDGEAVHFVIILRKFVYSLLGVFFSEKELRSNP